MVKGGGWWCAGAYGATISGAGPTAVAVVDSQETGQKVLQAMCKAFREAGQLEVNSAQVVKLDMEGARF
ncbi:GHMP_kinases_C domain-containing protein, partial [Haematococcus lacustris]